MKKILLLAALAVAAISCQKDTFVATLELLSEQNVTVSYKGEVCKVKFNTNSAWTASLDVDKDVATLKASSGEAGENTAKVTIQKFSETNTSRTIVLTISVEGAEPIVVTFIQEGKYEAYFEIDQTSFDFDAAGGNAEFNINTNVEYTVEVTDGMDSWAPYTADGTKYGVAVAANNNWGVRTGYITFTVPSIQDAVLDDDGNATEATTDHTVSVAINQSGLATTPWSIDMISGFAGAGKCNSIAVSGNVLLQANENGLWAYNRTDGSLIKQVELPDGMTLTGINADDKGNVVATTGGTYEEEIAIYSAKASDIAEGSAKFGTLASFTNTHYGYGIDNVRAAGDVFGDGVVSLIEASSPGDGGSYSYIIYLDVNGGKAAAEDSISIAHMNEAGCNMWNPRTCCAAPAGTSSADGFYFTGYDDVTYEFYLYRKDGTYNALFNNTGDWAVGADAIEVFDWNGGRYAAYVLRSYFATWGCVSYFAVANLDTNEIVYSTGYSNPAGFLYSEYADGDQAGSVNADIAACVESDGSLSIYVLDGSWGVFAATNLPVIK